MSLVYARTGDYESALETHKNALKLDPFYMLNQGAKDIPKHVIDEICNGAVSSFLHIYFFIYLFIILGQLW